MAVIVSTLPFHGKQFEIKFLLCFYLGSARKGVSTVCWWKFHTFFFQMCIPCCYEERWSFFFSFFFFSLNNSETKITLILSFYLVAVLQRVKLFVVFKDRYLFCSGAYDGKVNLYSALRMELLMCYQITTMTLARNVNAVRFTSDGSRVRVMSTLNRGLLIVCTYQ